MTAAMNTTRMRGPTLPNVSENRARPSNLCLTTHTSLMAAKVSFPARCAVAVVCGDHLVSQVYPASVPVEMFIDNIVELLDEELKRRGLPGLDLGMGYELHKSNGVRL